MAKTKTTADADVSPDYSAAGVARDPTPRTTVVVTTPVALYTADGSPLGVSLSKDGYQLLVSDAASQKSLAEITELLLELLRRKAS